MPQRAEDVRQFASFLEEMRDKVFPRDGPLQGRLPVVSTEGEEDPRVSVEQREELETLEAFYPAEEFPDDVARVAPRWPVRLAMRLAGGTGSTLRFTFAPSYPQAGPLRCELHSEDVGVLAHEKDILAAAEEERAPLGFPSVVVMFQAAQQWVEDHEADIAARAASGGVLPAATGADGDEDGDDDDAPADAWWKRDREDPVDEALIQEAEKKAAELLPDDGSGTAWARAFGAGNYNKPWEFVVGLVGKPSAGKSTLFNAATRPEEADREAAMAPHPFTTIDPNVGPGWFAAPCPAEALGLGDKVQPEHGRAPSSRRRLPLLVKDVAGLVPGAYLGRGKGNAFLNDLCDADSLIHVVDASGRSDREGVDQGRSGGGGGGGSATSSGDGGASSDPLEEVGWVRHEIHLWIFCNVREKWDTIRRKARMATTAPLREHLADRLFGLFTGYRATRPFVTQVFEKAGFKLNDVFNWTEYHAHLFVACFLRARFPIMVALNKADVPGAGPRIERARKVLGSSCVAVSARSEWWLWDQQRKGHLTYLEGGGADTVELAPAAPAAVREQLEKMKAAVFRVHGCTGVQEILSAAVQRRQPLYVCPVSDLGTLEPLQKMSEKDTRAPAALPPLATMLLMRPLSTVDEAFRVIRHEQMLRGDFVRAEVLTDLGSRTSRVLKREDALRGDGDPTKAIVLKVLSNKKAK